MLKLHQLFLIHFSLIFIGTFVFSGFVSYFTLKDTTHSNYERRLQDALQLMTLQVQSLTELQNLVQAVHERTKRPITIITPQGEVLASTFSQEKIEGTDWKNLPEIQEAILYGSGKALHYDSDKAGYFYYLAKKVEMDGVKVIITMGLDANEVDDGFYELWLKILIIFIISMVVGLVITHFINNKVKDEMEKITTFLDNITNKRYKKHYTPSFSSEFDSIYHTLVKLAKKMEKRDKKIRKHTASLRLKNQQNMEIISAISHEFKNPIAIILGYSQTLTDDKNINDNIRDRFLQKIAYSANKLSLLIDRLALSAKLENKTLEANIGTFNIYEICHDVKSQMEEKYKDRRVEIHGQSRFVEADRALTELVLSNLVENALKYSEDVVMIEITNHQVRVIDRGVGISQDDIKQVTEKFFRVDKHSWNNSLGLGLSIVKYILKLHDTKLKIESEPGEGSVFWFEI